jgi:hypothetical protein
MLTITRLFFTTHARLHLRVVASAALLTEEVAALVVFLTGKLAKDLGKPDSMTKRSSNRPGRNVAASCLFGVWHFWVLTGMI